MKLPLFVYRIYTAKDLAEKSFFCVGPWSLWSLHFISLVWVSGWLYNDYKTNSAQQLLELGLSWVQ